MESGTHQTALRLALPSKSKAMFPRRWLWREVAVYAVVITLVAVRFFTERFVILPRFLNAIDLVAIPFLLPFCLRQVMVKQGGRFKGKTFIILSGLFCTAWALAWLVNYEEVHWLGGGMFIIGLLTPIVFFLILTNLGLDRLFCQRLVRLLEILLIINLLIGAMDMILALKSGEGGADFILGTFGVNQNQLSFFLAVMMSYQLARWRYQGLQLTGLFILVWTSVLFLLCGFQTLWVALAIAAVGVFWFAGKLSKHLLRITVLVVLFIAVTMPPLMQSGRFFSVLDKLDELVTTFNELGKVELLRNVPQIWQIRPWSFWIGVGPGTFNSRAFRNIAIVPYQGGVGFTDVAAAIVEPFYTSELSSQFIIPYFERGIFRLSGGNTDAPFTSYVSVPVEAGVPGALAFFGIYASAAFALVKAVRKGIVPERRTLAAWALMNLLMLLGIAAVDNYLETTRYTLLVWLSLAIWRIDMQEGAKFPLHGEGRRV